MRRVMEAWRRLRALLWRRELERGLDEEIRFHLDQQIAKNVRAGMAPREAHRRAMMAFGGVDRTKESTRDQFRTAFVEDFVRDLRYGARALLRAPGFTIAATLTLALGIGATTAMFSVVNGVLLRPLPYADQDRLIELVHEAPGLGARRLLSSPAIYFAYRDHNRTFDAVGHWDWDSSPVTVTGAGEPEAVESREVTHEVLGILGAEPILGRGFRDTDDLPGSAATAIISHGYWQRRFHGANPLGQTLVVEGVPRQVIGVLAPSFRFFDTPADIFYPMQLVRSNASFPSFDGRGIARLKKGVTLAQANADVARMIPLLRAEFSRSTPASGADPSRFGPNLRWLRDSVIGDLGDTLWLLMGTIGLLLTIACANVANLVLVRTQTRRSELAIRAALGAGWGGIARVVFAESAVLGLAGGAAGLLVAYASLPLLLSLGAEDLPQIMAVTIDPTVLLFTAGTAVLAACMFALIPVFRFSLPRLQLSRALHGGGRSSTEGREGSRVRHALVVSQVALALVLLIGSGLMIRTFQTLRSVDPGFEDGNSVQTFQLTIPEAAAPDAERATAAYRERTLRTQQAVLERLAAVGGVEAAGFAGYSDGLPLDGDGRSSTIYVDGRPPVVDGIPEQREIQFVSPRFFETLGTRLIAGRTFDWSDVYNNRRVVVISENLARTEWGSGAAAVGKRIGTRPSGPWSDVVGVVADVHHNGLSQPAPETVTFPVVPTETRRGQRTACFVIRSPRVGTAGFMKELQSAIWSVNPSLALADVQTLGEMYRHSMARTTMTLRLLAITGTMALLLGLIGIYGVVSYAVAQRRREIGIRLALGARPGEVRRMFVKHALVLVGIGVAIGLGASAGLTRLMASQLFGVSPLDPPTHLAVALGLVAAAAAASYLSAQRAAALDPVEVLKGE